MLDGLLDRIEEELGKKVTALATGGLLSFIIPHCKREFIREDNLIFKAFYQIYLKNKSHQKVDCDGNT